MKKVNITLSFEDEKLDALEFSLKKENSSTQAKMEAALSELYEQTVPAPVKEYLESKSEPAAKARRPKPEKPDAAKQAPKPKTESRPEPPRTAPESEPVGKEMMK